MVEERREPTSTTCGWRSPSADTRRRSSRSAPSRGAWYGGPIECRPSPAQPGSLVAGARPRAGRSPAPRRSSWMSRGLLLAADEVAGRPISSASPIHPEPWVSIRRDCCGHHRRPLNIPDAVADERFVTRLVAGPWLKSLRRARPPRGAPRCWANSRKPFSPDAEDDSGLCPRRPAIQNASFSARAGAARRSELALVGKQFKGSQLPNTRRSHVHCGITSPIR